MSYNIVKNSFFFLIITLIVPVGYMVGLSSNPNHAATMPPAAFTTRSVLPIENALQDEKNIKANPVDVTAIENPFQNGKIYNLTPKKNQKVNNKKSRANDPRITKIDSSLFEMDDDYIDNSNEVIIEIPGSDTQKDIMKTSQDPVKVAALKQEKKTDFSLFDAYKNERKALLKAPLSDYLQASPFGRLPYQPKGLMPLYKRYGNNTHAHKNNKYLSVIVGGLGMNQELTLEAIKTLPPEVTLGFIPYSKNLQQHINLARQYGHETILEIPLESYDYPRSDVGHKVLLTSLDEKQNQDRLFWFLGRATGYSGIMNYLGGKYLLDPQVKTVLSEAKKRGLYFVENKTIKAGLAADQAKNLSAYYNMSSDILDSTLSTDFIKEKLARTEKMLSNQYHTTVTAYASPLTLSILRNNLLQYKQKNIQLLPVSSTIQ